MFTLLKETAMAQDNKTSTKPVRRASLSRWMLEGSAIALILFSFFLIGAGEPKPEWEKFWMIKPFLIIPVAGAIGGAFCYYMGRLRRRGGWKTVLGYVMSLVGYLLALWIGTVLGLDGTYWN